MRLLFSDGSRLIFRLSGTGSVGATVRLYIEKYVAPGDEAALSMETADALAPLVSQLQADEFAKWIKRGRPQTTSKAEVEGSHEAPRLSSPPSSLLLPSSP